MSKIIIGIIIFFMTTLSSFCGAAENLKVVTTLFPLYDFIRQVGGDRVEVSLLLPPGVEPHSFEPRPRDIVRISQSDIFIYTGDFMEPWAKNLLRNTMNHELLVVDASRGIELISSKHDEDEHENVKGKHKRKRDGGEDPHIWLDLLNAQTMVETITEAMIAKDTAGQEFYRLNSENYKTRLAAFDRKIKNVLETCKNKTVIFGGHLAFGYFAKRYGLNFRTPYKGIAPNAEPTSKDIITLIHIMDREGAKYVYFEELVDPKVARILSEATGAKLLLLNGAHNISRDDFRRGVTFLSLMEYNLKQLQKGLSCPVGDNE